MPGLGCEHLDSGIRVQLWGRLPSPNSAATRGSGLRSLSLLDSLTPREGAASHGGDVKSSSYGPPNTSLPKETFPPDPNQRHQASSGFPKVRVSIPTARAPRVALKENNVPTVVQRIMREGAPGLRVWASSPGPHKGSESGHVKNG